MKKVIMQVSIAADAFSYVTGDKTELDDKLAEVWDQVGHCRIIGDAAPDPDDTPENAEIIGRLGNLGGSYWRLSNGSIKKGLVEAVAAERALLQPSEPEQPKEPEQPAAETENKPTVEQPQEVKADAVQSDNATGRRARNARSGETSPAE